MIIGEVRAIKEMQKLCPTPHEESNMEGGSEDGDWPGGEFQDDEQEELDLKLVEAARREEVEFIEALPVYEVVDESEAWDVTGRAPIFGRWVGANNGSKWEPIVRSRWVSRDFKPRRETEQQICSQICRLLKQRGC